MLVCAVGCVSSAWCAAACFNARPCSMSCGQCGQRGAQCKAADEGEDELVHDDSFLRTEVDGLDSANAANHVLDASQSTRWRVLYSLFRPVHATRRTASSLVDAAARENIAAAANTGLSAWKPTHFVVPSHAFSCAS